MSVHTFEVLIAVIFDLSTLMVVHPICAYIDPGTGSMLLQIILGSVLASLVAIKLFWHQLKALAGRLVGRSSKKTQPPEKIGAETKRPEGPSDV